MLWFSEIFNWDGIFMQLMSIDCVLFGYFFLMTWWFVNHVTTILQCFIKKKRRKNVLSFLLLYWYNCGMRENCDICFLSGYSGMGAHIVMGAVRHFFLLNLQNLFVWACVYMLFCGFAVKNDSCFIIYKAFGFVCTTSFQSFQSFDKRNSAKIRTVKYFFFKKEYFCQL